MLQYPNEDNKRKQRNPLQCMCYAAKNTNSTKQYKTIRSSKRAKAVEIGSIREVQATKLQKLVKLYTRISLLLVTEIGIQMLQYSSHPIYFKQPPHITWQ